MVDNNGLKPLFLKFEKYLIYYPSQVREPEKKKGSVGLIYEWN